MGLGPGDIVLDGDQRPPPRKGAQQPPHFLARFALVQSRISATAELLYTSDMSVLNDVCSQVWNAEPAH